MEQSNEEIKLISGDEERGEASYLVESEYEARDAYQHFIEHYTGDSINDGEDQWHTVASEGFLSDLDYPVIVIFYINWDHADRHEVKSVPVNGLSALAPHLFK